MRSSKRLWIALGLLLPLLALATYHVGRRCWGSYDHFAAQRALEGRDYRQAHLHLQRYKSLWPDRPAGWLLAARMARRQDNFEQALEHLRVCRQKNGSSPVLDLEYQLIRVQKGDLSESNQLLARCIDHPDEAETYLVLEALIKGNLKVLSALTALKQTPASELAAPYLNNTQNLVELWFQRRLGRADQVEGLVWRGQLDHFKDAAKAQADFRKALELDPDHFGARMELAMSIIQKSPEEAVVHFWRLRERYPENNVVRFSLVSCLRGLGQLKEAMRISEEMLAANPDDVAALIERGYIALDMQKIEEAEYWLRRAVKLAPNVPRSHLALSCCLHVAGKETEAKQHQERFEQLETEEKRSKEDAVRILKAEVKKGQDQPIPK